MPNIRPKHRREVFCLDQWPTDPHLCYGACVGELTLSLGESKLRKLLLLPLLAMCAGLATGTEPQIRLPVIKPIVNPVEPVVAPVVLSPDVLYMIDSDIQLVVIGSPGGLIKVTEEAGPLRVRGKFIDGNGAWETRNYKGKFVYTVDAVAGKYGPCELLVIPVGVKAESEIIRKQIVVAQSQVSPLPPEPPTPNPPVPDPAPTTPAKLILLVIEETSDAAATRGALFTDATLAKRMQDKGHRWRVVDKDVVGSDGKTPADLLRFMELAKAKKLPQVFLVDEDGKVRFQGDMPSKASDVISLLSKFGG